VAINENLRSAYLLVITVLVYDGCPGEECPFPTGFLCASSHFDHLHEFPQIDPEAVAEGDVGIAAFTVSTFNSGVTRDTVSFNYQFFIKFGSNV
jgi:hypothetical protein